MCYTISAKLQSMLKRARHYGMDDLMDEIEGELDVYTGEERYVASGFAHPKLVVYTGDTAPKPVVSTWGLVPHWVKDNPQKLWNSTLNARGETIFEKPSFRKAARSQRCLVDIDGFFEYHHQRGKKYPFYITRKDSEVMTLGGLWDQWIDRSTGELMHTFSIVTQAATGIMKRIHNNPKLPEPRMPLLLEHDQEELWQSGSIAEIEQILRPAEKELLGARPVPALSGKKSPGNTPEALEEFVYEELELELP